jgi:hypothetical protein
MSLLAVVVLLPMEVVGYSCGGCAAGGIVTADCYANAGSLCNYCTPPASLGTTLNPLQSNLPSVFYSTMSAAWQCNVKGFYSANGANAVNTRTCSAAATSCSYSLGTIAMTDITVINGGSSGVSTSTKDSQDPPPPRRPAGTVIMPHMSSCPHAVAPRHAERPHGPAVCKARTRRGSADHAPPLRSAHRRSAAPAATPSTVTT